MKILFVHNFYQQPGGEDVVVAQEANLLRRAGHEVVPYYRSNAEIDSFGWRQKAALPKRFIWASDAAKDLQHVIREIKPDIAHFHNTHFMISPSAYHACQQNGVPVVQSLHNPRLLCPSANFYRNGLVCQECAGKTIPWKGIVHACYKDSHLLSSLMAGRHAFHSLLKTWTRQVDTYIVFSEFYRKVFEEYLLPSDKLVIKPHFIETDPGMREDDLGDYVLYIGRLDPEKGIKTLITAWQTLAHIPLKIRGDGRLEKYIRDQNLPSVELIDRLSKPDLVRLIKGARFLVWPSEGYYETFGLVAIEAFACGVPVIASKTGVNEYIVRDGETGLHFVAGNKNDLRSKIDWAWSNPSVTRILGLNARAEYEAKYTAERNYELLMAIYEQVIERRRSRQ